MTRHHKPTAAPQDTPKARRCGVVGIACNASGYYATHAVLRPVSGPEKGQVGVSGDMCWQIAAVAPVAHSDRAEAVKDAMEWLSMFEPEERPIIIGNIVT